MSLLAWLSWPPGLRKCRKCGDWRGTSHSMFFSNYDWPDGWVTVSCKCEGPLCRVCGKNRVRRPISTTYTRTSNWLLHVPYFAAMAPCVACQQNAITPPRWPIPTGEEGRLVAVREARERMRILLFDPTRVSELSYFTRNHIEMTLQVLDEAFIDVPGFLE